MQTTIPIKEEIYSRRVNREQAKKKNDLHFLIAEVKPLCTKRLNINVVPFAAC